MVVPTYDLKPVTVRDIHAEEHMTAALKSYSANLARQLEHTALVHGGLCQRINTAAAVEEATRLLFVLQITLFEGRFWCRRTRRVLGHQVQSYFGLLIGCCSGGNRRTCNTTEALPKRAQPANVERLKRAFLTCFIR